MDMKTEKKCLTVLILTVLLMILATACLTEGASISKKSVTLKKGSSVRLTIRKANTKKIKWKTSRKSVATVNKKGLVKAVGVGTATITATVKNKKFKCKVKVQPVPTNKIDDNTVGMTAQQAKIYRAMKALKTKFPEGKRFTNLNYYEWNGGIYLGDFGCSAFAFLLSDAAFGTARARRHTNFDDIRVGDIVRLEYNTHSVVIMKAFKDYFVVAEGNYKKKVHWGRIISRSYIKKTGIYVMTRYGGVHSALPRPTFLIPFII